MNCNCFMACILGSKSNLIFNNILEIRPSLLCRSKFVIRTDLRKPLSSYFLGANNCYTIHRKVCKTEIQDVSPLLSTKLKLPLHLSACNYHLSLILNNVDKNAEKLNSETKETEKKSLGTDGEPELPQKTLIQKFKLMYKQYWYVLIPVHVATSLVWYGTFFFAAKSGVDIVPILEKLGITEKFLAYMRESNAGYYGIAYAMYKIATPARYTITVGGTTIAINYLKKRGYIKPIPTKQEFKEMIEDKKDELKEKREEIREIYQEKRDEFFDKYHDKRDEFLDKYHDKRDEIKDRYNDKRSKFFDKYGYKMDKDEHKKDQTNLGKKISEEEKKR